MADPEPGLYETLITEALAERLRALPRLLEPFREKLRPAEAADRIALHVGRILVRAIDDIPPGSRTTQGIHLARKIVELLVTLLPSCNSRPEAPVEPGEVLLSLLSRRPDGTSEPIDTPMIPLLDTTLLSNAPGEPRVGSQILREIGSANRIDVVMAFIRRSGIAPFLDALRRHCNAGREFRILTTTYTGTTEARALEALRDAGAEVRVSYDTTSTRLHAKAWIFHRASGFSTAYIGSSNWTRTAHSSGLEWNVRISGARNPDVIAKTNAIFESYWQSGDFQPYDPAEFARRSRQESSDGTTILLSPLEVRLEPFQERLLEEIALSRRQGHHRNLLVSATGTGKTVMAAVDYARLRDALPRDRLLFVAHREEILTQSLAVFRQALRDPAFGELWVGSRRPTRFEHVFASIQSLHASGLVDLHPSHFDVVVVDEFHHAAARSYSALLEHVQPIEILGLTATPERSDGLPILDLFGGRIAAELRLWDAIDQRRLCPFLYYGIHDGLDFRDIPWRRGRGYDVESLFRLFTANDVWAKLVIQQVVDRADNLSRLRALGFCVSVAHAQFMARMFQQAGLGAKAVWGDTPAEERGEALKDLRGGRIKVLFSVDLFNEGVDLPMVDTLLLLRPTDSPTLFLQQLGRGLRLAPDKDSCVVLDFVGLHRKEFRMDRRLRTLVGGSRLDLERQVKEGFPFLPAGCHMELDPVATGVVLSNLREAIPTRWLAKVEELRRLRAVRGDVRLGDYMEETGLELADVYDGGKSWSDLLQDAQVPVLPAGPKETELRRACGRLLHMDDLERIDGYRKLLAAENGPDVRALSVRQKRLARMLVAAVAEKALDKDDSIEEAWTLLWRHPQVREELKDLLDTLASQITHVHARLDTHPDVPLHVHARYTRVEILAAFGVKEHAARVPPWQTGVHWGREAKADLLAFTLDKTSGQFSPTTRYRDHAINRELIHWESQSVTRADSETGRRYQHHVKLNSSILLFARLRAEDRAFWFLGPATYVRHESECPMAITWRLRHLLPGDLFAAFAAAVA